MAQRRRRHVRRDVLVFLGSLAAHIGLFFLLSSEFRFYPPPEETQPAVQVELVPEVPEPIPPIPPPKPVPTPKPAPVPQPAAPPQPQPPQPQPPQPAPKPVVVKAPQVLTAKPAPTPTAPVKLAPLASPAPAPKLANLPSPLPPPTPAPAPGPPQAVSRSSLIQSQPQIVSQRRMLLHKNQDQGAPLAAPVSIPGAVFAPSPNQAAASGTPGAPGGGAAGGGGAGGLPGGVLPHFGGGLRGSLIGCANAEALHLSREEQARCNESLGAGAAQSPQMSAIDASKRRTLDGQAASEAASQKYRDSAPAGAWNTPQAGQPRDGQSPGSP